MSRCGGRVRLFLSPVWRAKTKEDAAASPELNCTSRPLAVEGWVIAWRVLERRPRLCADLCRIRRACDAPGTALFVLFGLGKPVPPAKPAAVEARGSGLTALPSPWPTTSYTIF